MCRCMDWMGASISRSRLSSDARTWCGLPFPAESRGHSLFSLTSTYVDGFKRMPGSLSGVATGSRKSWPKGLFSGPGQVVL